MKGVLRAIFAVEHSLWASNVQVKIIVCMKKQNQIHCVRKDLSNPMIHFLMCVCAQIRGHKHFPHWQLSKIKCANEHTISLFFFSPPFIQSSDIIKS